MSKQSFRGRALCLELDATNKLAISYGKPRQRKEKKPKKDKGEGKGKQSGRPHAPSGPLACGNGYRLNVKYLPEEVGGTVEKLKELFAPFGNVTDAQLKFRDDGKSRGLGYVVFASEAEATKAAEELDGKQLGGKSLSVTPAERRLDDASQWADAAAYWTNMAQAYSKGTKGAKGKGKGKGKQMMQQFTAMQTAYSSAYMQMWNSASQQTGSSDEKRGRTSSAGAEAAGEEIVSPAEYTGVLKFKMRYGAKKSYISCAETYQYYATDIYIDKEAIPDGAKDGHSLRFKVATRYGEPIWDNGYCNTPLARGYPKARTVSVAK